jgi:hypothetical protein
LALSSSRLVDTEREHPAAFRPADGRLQHLAGLAQLQAAGNALNASLTGFSTTNGSNNNSNGTTHG